MRILVVTVQVPFITGGAEILAKDLTEILRAEGHEAELLEMPWCWYPNERLYESLLAFRLLDFETCGGREVDLVICLKFPAYLVRHPRKVMWLVHQHRMAYELWSTPFGLANTPDGRSARKAILRADLQAMEDCAAVYTISQRVSDRLLAELGVESEPLYPPPRNIGRFECGEDRGFVFFPSRITPLKRQRLAIQALASTREPVRLVLSGAADAESLDEELRDLATDLEVDDRIEWLGRIGEDQLLACYAECRCVLFPPLDEDYGYVTLEAMLSSKPVITCSDSGGPLEFVEDGRSGWIVEPEVETLAAALDEAWRAPDISRALGRAGRRRWEELEIGWPAVVGRLLAPVTEKAAPTVDAAETSSTEERDRC